MWNHSHWTVSRRNQRDAIGDLQNLSTVRQSRVVNCRSMTDLSRKVATFFSAVTATTLQYSFVKNDAPIDQAVNLLWVTSLVFSLASIINSQLTYNWRSAIYRSPGSVIPWWGAIWITGTPLAFLSASVLAFSAGLVCFTFSVFPHTLVPVVTVVFTAVSWVSRIALHPPTDH